MRFDKDVMREILLAVEASDEDPRGWIEISIQGRSNQEVAYHVQLLDEAGFIEAADLSSTTGYDWMPKRLTYAGQELLDTIREPEIWRATKETAKRAGAFSVQALFEIGKAYTKQKLQERGVHIP